jgi:hypothetical protein
MLWGRGEGGESTVGLDEGHVHRIRAYCGLSLELEGWGGSTNGVECAKRGGEVELAECTRCSVLCRIVGGWVTNFAVDCCPTFLVLPSTLRNDDGIDIGLFSILNCFCYPSLYFRAMGVNVSPESLR